MADFIVDDEDVEAEMEEEQPEKHRKKKKRKHRELPKLDEEDIDIIAENTGMNLKRHKRLQKQSEREGHQVKDEDEALFAKAPAREDSVDTTRKRVITPAGRPSEGDYVPSSIFQDPKALDARVRSNKAKAQAEEPV